MKEEIIVISLGGSLIVPEEIDVDFLKDFKNLIISQVEKGKKFIIITGGGRCCRKYLDALKQITNPSDTELDLMGIAFTRMNADLVRIIFGDIVYSKLILDPDLIPITDKHIMVGGGWRPGNSSDLASIHCAISVNSKKVINLSNIDYVYDKDPNKFSDAKKIENISWEEFRKILPLEWNPGLNTPFDPVAAKKSEEQNIEVAIMNGKNLENLENYLNGEKFIGTVIK
ncbi:UMP kinase [Candidatus Nomurabacteria bacterium]|nr:UMP kinase [Candidatus Nomurabacteria bacterium]